MGWIIFFSVVSRWEILNIGPVWKGCGSDVVCSVCRSGSGTRNNNLFRVSVGITELLLCLCVCVCGSILSFPGVTLGELIICFMKRFITQFKKTSEYYWCVRDPASTSHWLPWLIAMVAEDEVRCYCCYRSCFSWCLLFPCLFVLY